MQGRTYRDQLSRGEVMAGFTLGEVIAGDLPSGAVVACEAGWQEYVVLSTAAVRPVTVRGELTHYLGALGVNGLTAYFGLLEVGRPRPGETVVVSGALRQDLRAACRKALTSISITSAVQSWRSPCR